MTSQVALDSAAQDLPTSSAELEFALVLARFIGSMENDPAQMRNVVYELARLKLQKEAWQRHPPITVKDSRRLMLALEAAIDRVETISSRRDELRAPLSLDRLIERSSIAQQQHEKSIEHNPVLTIEQEPSISNNPTPISTFLPSTAHAPRKLARRRTLSRLPQLLEGCLVAAVGVVGYVILDRQIGLFGPTLPAPIEAVAPVNQGHDVAATSPSIRPQRRVLPIVYGVYAISHGQLNELEPLGVAVPDQRVFMSAVIKRPSRTYLPDGGVEFIVFRRDIATSAPVRVSVRIIARIARTMKFNPTASVTPVDDEWAMRSTSYELRVAPMNENPEMLVLRPEDPNFVFPAGRYALVLKGQAFDFTVVGPATEATHCLERTETANGTIYSECRIPEANGTRVSDAAMPDTATTPPPTASPGPRLKFRHQ